jgi:putative ABC transport system ATP-binding protein
MTILKLDRLNKRFEESESTYLFKNVTSQIERSEIIALLGESGQGKSTLLRILSLLDRLSEGEIYLYDKPSEQYNPREWRKKVCYVAQQPVMFPDSVEDNLRIDSHIRQHENGRLGTTPWDDDGDDRCWSKSN